ncbi:MAG: hypothetical protein K2J95_00910, partial [Lachnospiraceae bacterium]|nr:hypothetical protein [Lachnospiraceae bacterium]
TKKAGKKKRVIITVTAALVVLLALSVPFVMRYHNYTKEICVMEPVDRMLLRQGVGRDKILVEIGYSIIKNGEVVENIYLFLKMGMFIRDTI